MISVSIFSGVSLILLSLIISYLYRFYSNVRHYPPGPLPIPVFGNVLMLVWKRKVHPYYAIHDACRAYGSVTTFWFGSIPAILINDLEIGKNAFNQLTFSGRPPMPVRLVASGQTFAGYVLQDYSVSVKLHRKISIDAIRELLLSQKLSALVNSIVRETVDTIVLREGFDKPFSPDFYFPRMPLRILAVLTFGECVDDKQLLSIEHSFEAFNQESIKLFLIQLFPVSRYYLSTDAKSESEMRKFPVLVETSFTKYKASYKAGNCDNFASCLLTTRIKMMNNGEERRSDDNTASLVTDDDLIAVLGTLFFGGIHTSSHAFDWYVLLVAHYTEMQQKLRIEINNKIGTDICPQLEHRKHCHYVNAFIHEVLRFRPVVPFGAPHTTMSDTVIAGYQIPKNTMLFMNQVAILNDPLYWKNPEKFSPERFLDSSGLFITARFPAFIQFNFGKRMCPGDRMAVEMLFLEVVCLLQATNGYHFELLGGPQNSDLDVNSYPAATPIPKPYKIVLKQIKKQN